MANSNGTYPSYLPAHLQQDPLLNQFLLAFEQILTGGLVPNSGPGLEETIDTLHTYFTPQASPGQAPEAFLPWLASWVALSLRADWSEATKRGFIRRVVPLYKLRGTKAGLEKLLELYVNGGTEPDPSQVSNDVEIFEFEQPAHYFQVTIKLPNRDNLERNRAIARAILDQEKPAHTFYVLQLLFDTMQIVNNPATPDGGLRLGVNTLLGTESS